jgi:hypothetical protein
MAKELARARAGQATASVRLFCRFIPAMVRSMDRTGAQVRLRARCRTSVRTSAEYERLIVIHAGWIPDCFSEVVDRSFCFVHIDVDLYEPTLASLEFFGSRMVPGGIIVCDDYGFETCPGARRAGDEFAAARAIRSCTCPRDRASSFLVIRER